MWKDAYIETRVLSANPVELVCLLYGHAIDSVGEARRHLAAGEIAARSQSISRAIADISELEASLDHTSGGAVSLNLAELYRYIRRRLTEGNMQQKDAPLAEAESLLGTLAGAWSAVRVPPAEPVAPQAFAAPPVGAWMEMDAGLAHAWSA